ncbi:hypothetical protein LTR66_014567 [Elasticomyces elasticus]|nr:hypothetical protein LTR66_014567 [Elasticomyces elasticus]KAK4987368.1 hypothetical protein LTR50_004703 [Elasticomyces elasticus]KAK5003680.1 hypothetical protein LTR28_009870 [Elasticomyces elasticus]
MDTTAYLKKQGWKGLGHSLNPNDPNLGLKRPLLISKKVDVLGLGIKKHDVLADQWWMRAFDSSLKALGTGERSTLSSVRTQGVKKGGLYGFFVKGEGVPGTLPNTPEMTSGVSTPLEEHTVPIKSKKRKRKEDAVDTTSANDNALRAAHKKREKKPETRRISASPSPPPSSSAKTSRPEEREVNGAPAEERARRKRDSMEKAKRRAVRKTDKAKAEGTWDPAKEEEKRKAKELKKHASLATKELEVDRPETVKSQDGADYATSATKVSKKHDRTKSDKDARKERRDRKRAAAEQLSIDHRAKRKKKEDKSSREKVQVAEESSTATKASVAAESQAGGEDHEHARSINHTRYKVPEGERRPDESDAARFRKQIKRRRKELEGRRDEPAI